MIRFSNCKLNLGLYVTAKRPDGYHEIRSVMYPVDDLNDAIEVVPSDSDGVEFTSSGLLLDCPEDKNLCVRTYRLMKERYGIGGVKMHIHKTVPFGAGLGGGSSDAVCVIRLLDDLFCLRLDEEEMESVAGELGSDTVFFVRNRPAMASGRGEIIRPIDLSLEGWHVLVVKPDFSVGTAQAYGGICPRPMDAPLEELIGAGPECWKDRLKNDFEEPVFRLYPELARIKSDLYDAGAVYAAMSGSGSAVFGLFREEPRRPEYFEKYFVHSGKLL